MKFRYILAGYVAVWIAFIICICAWEWVALGKFQTNYTGDTLSKDILNEMKTKPQEQNNGAAENVTTEATTTIAMLSFDLIVDNTMSVEVNGKKADFTNAKPIYDNLYEDYKELTGRDLGKKMVTVEAESFDHIVVKNQSGEVISADDRDYIEGNYRYQDDLAAVAIRNFEPYIRHINKQLEMGDLLSVMRGESKAYKAVKASQQSLKWMQETSSLTFNKEEVSDMQIFDEDHFACDVNMDIDKVAISSSGRGIPVSEKVSYRVLYEKVNGKWYIYSFLIK